MILAWGELATSLFRNSITSTGKPKSKPSLFPVDRLRSPTMNYGKKDDDADTALVKVDRTQVFQEGELPQNEPAGEKRN